MVAWRKSEDPVPFPTAQHTMEDMVRAITSGTQEECIWLLEHPSTYTAGTSADMRDLLDSRLVVHPAGRGGKLTWHGPGQRIIYTMIDLRKREISVHDFVHGLEDWGIAALAWLGVEAERVPGHVGVFTGTPPAKIAAIGVRVRHGITFHGMAINVTPDLAEFSGIVPCGIRNYGVTSLAACGFGASMQDLDAALRQTCPFKS